MEIDKLSLAILRAINQRGPMVEQLRELLADVPTTKIGQTGSACSHCRNNCADAHIFLASGMWFCQDVDMETIKSFTAICEILNDNGITASVEYPAAIHINCADGRVFVVGDINETVCGDCYGNLSDYENGSPSEDGGFDTGLLPSADANDLACAIMSSLA